MKKTRLFYLVAALSTALFALLQVVDPSIVREYVESRTYDLRVRLRDHLHPRKAPDNVLIVAVDEKSVAEIGRWPWGRDVIADLVGRISSGGPAVIGVDVLFTERESPESDERLAAALRKAGNAVLSMGFFVPKGKSVIPSPADVPDSLFDVAFMDVRTVRGIPWKKFAVRAESALPPLPEFAASSSAIGHVYSLPDRDGVLRWECLSVNYGDDCYPSLGLQVARYALGIPMKEMILYGGSGVQLGGRFLPTDLHGRALINYLGEERTFPYLSAADVLRGRAPPDRFRGKIVLIGTSALGLYDQKVTPLSANMPGVEKNANVVANILGNDFLRRSPGIVELAVILATGLLLGFLLPRYAAAGSVVIALGTIAAYLALTDYLSVYKDLWLGFVYPFANIVVLATTDTVISLFYEERKAREIRRIFSSYVSPKIVEQLVNHPEKAKLGGERKEVTLLFSDIRGFTSFSEKRAPEEVVAMLNEYFDVMAGIVFHWDGTLDKFIGDAILAFWGAPLDQPDHAERAVRCALHMSDALRKLQEKWRAEGKEAMDCGIGINTGEVVIGNIGSHGRKMDYTVIGDHVNLGSRVQGLTKKYSTRILITEFTYEKIRPIAAAGKIGHLDMLAADTVTVRGKEVPVNVYALSSDPH
jgi:adenylate cyclase